MDLLMELVGWLQRNSIVPVMVMFCVILVWTYWPGRKDQVERQGQIPLHDDP